MIFNKNFFYIEGDLIDLKLIDIYEGNDNDLPFYWYSIILKSQNVAVGKISIRIGHNYNSYYNGNIGYEIDKQYRGNNYAYLACLMVIPVARYYGMNKVYLTCSFNNIASSKTIEKLGAKLIEEVVPPSNYAYYYGGIPKQKIYELKI